MTLSEIEGPISASDLIRNKEGPWLQGVEDSSDLKNESATQTADKYRISNKEFRIMKFFSFDIRYSLFDIYPPTFWGGPVLFCRSLDSKGGDRRGVAEGYFK